MPNSNLEWILTADKFYANTKYIFEKNKIKTLSVENMFMDYIKGCSLPSSIKSNNFIDFYELDSKLRLIWHSVAGVQNELASFLIYSSQINYQNINTNENILTLTLCSHHLSIAYECLYRVWEKVSQVLFYLHFKHSKKTIYFNTVVNQLKKSGLYKTTIINSLNKQIKHWDKVAGRRNKYSHEASYLFNYQYKPSIILNSRGLPYSFEELMVDCRKEKNKLIERFRNLEKLNLALRGFIDNFPKSPILSVR